MKSLKVYPELAEIDKLGKEEKEENAYAAERELLQKQLELISEKSKDNCSAETLALLSQQMVTIY